MRRAAFSFYLSEFLTGGFVYCLIEILFRGYTHISMFFLGGICLLAIGMIRRQNAGAPLAKKMLCACGVITVLEFFCGLIVNRLLGLGVWDYSEMPYNLLGQVCLSYSAAWCLLALPAMGVDFLYFSRLGWKSDVPSGATYAACADSAGKILKKTFQVRESVI